VNTASRLERTAAAGSIQVSEAVADMLAPSDTDVGSVAFTLESLGHVELKDKGLTRTYTLSQMTA
jgi:class 3 adenylate cyclase